MSHAQPFLRKRFMPIVVANIMLMAGVTNAQDDASAILPGDTRFDTPEFTDYEAKWSSASSKTGAFTLKAIRTGQTLTLVDIIPTPQGTIVSQRSIDLATHRSQSSAGPYFAWGKEFVVAQNSDSSYHWTRVPLGGGKPEVVTGRLENGGAVSDMFSPTLAALMPMDVGSQFKLPALYPIQGGLVASEMDTYSVIRRERLDLAGGLSCQCWVLEKKAWSGSTELIWVSRDAPFVFRRIRDVGGKREFVSELLGYTPASK